MSLSRTSIWWPVLFSFLLIPAALQATPVDDKLKAFQNSVKNASSSKTFGGGVSPSYSIGRLPLPINADADEMTLQTQIQQIMAGIPNAEVQAAGKALIDELEAQKKVREDAMQTKVDAVLKGIPDVMTHAQKPADLDKTLTSLQDLSISRAGGISAMYSGYSGVDPVMQSLSTRISSAYDFVARWQDYLSEKQNGQTPEAKNTLNNLLNNRQPGAPSLLPRSLILEALAALDSTPAAGGVPGASVPAVIVAPQDTPQGQANQIIDDIKTLDDLEPALKKLQALSFKYPYPNQPNYDLVAHLTAVYLDARGGLPIQLEELAPNSPGLPGNGIMPNEAAIIRIRIQLYLYLIPLVLRLSGDDKPQANEALADYLNRMQTAAFKKGDLILARDVLRATSATTTAYAMDSGLLAGLNQEVAGQYELAVISYEGALKSSTVPVAFVTERLSIIKTAHPDEYAKAEAEYAKTNLDSVEDPYGRRFMQPYPPPIQSIMPPEKTKLAKPLKH